MFGWLWSNPSSIDHSKQRVFGAAESIFLKASQRYQGLGRVGEILRLEGPYISSERLNKALGHLQHRHRILRCRLQVHPDDPKLFILEQDETLRLEVEEISRQRTDHLDFWTNEWRRREKAPIRQGDVLMKCWLLQVCLDTFSDDHHRCICRIPMIMMMPMHLEKWY